MKTLVAIALFAVTGSGTAYAAGNALNTLKSEVPALALETTEVPPPTASLSACESNAITAIEQISRSILPYLDSPTIQNAKAVAAISRSCNSVNVRTAAVKACSHGLSSNSEPTTSVARTMESLCGDDAKCAELAVKSLGAGIFSYLDNPTMSVARSIVNIVKKAPYDAVKTEAISSLSKGISSNSHPTIEVSDALVEVGSCAAANNTAAK